MSSFDDILVYNGTIWVSKPKTSVSFNRYFANIFLNGTGVFTGGTGFIQIPGTFGSAFSASGFSLSGDTRFQNTSGENLTQVVVQSQISIINYLDVQRYSMSIFLDGVEIPNTTTFFTNIGDQFTHACVIGIMDMNSNSIIDTRIRRIDGTSETTILSFNQVGTYYST